MELKLPKGKGATVLLLIGALFAVFLLLYDGQTNTESETASNSGVQTEREALSSYQTTLESRVVTLLSHITGVSEVKVVISFECGYSREYLSDTLIKESPPQVSGVAVVCRGGNDPVIQQKILSLLCALFHLDSTEVAVSG